MFTLSAEAVAAIATLQNVTPKGKHRGMSPILDGIHLTVSKSGYIAQATDRYIVAEITGTVLDYIEDVETMQFVLADTDMVQILKASDRSPVRFELDDDASQVVASTSTGASFTFPTVDGNFPPVARMFSGWHELVTPQAPILSPAHLAAIAKVRTEARVFLKPAERAELSLQLAGTKGGEPNAPMHVRMFGNYVIATADGFDPDFRAIVQPVKPRIR